MKEEWRIIEGFERYEVSNYGRVRSNVRKEPLIMRQRTHYKGYKYVQIYREGVSEDIKCFIHRLVAFAFLNNPNNLPIVNHKNLDKGDNRIINLEWVTDSENQNHWRDARKTYPVDDIPF